VVVVGDAKVKVVEVTSKLVFGLPRAVALEHEGVSPLNKATVNGEVPPDHVTVTVTVAVCPASMAGGDTRGKEAERGGLIVSGEVDDAMVNGIPELSVTLAQ
jgi:hypothetical protein